MVYVQQTNIAYDSVNFDDPISTLSYFKKLYLSFALSMSSEEAGRHFDDLMSRIINTKTKKDSNESLEAKAQRIMRLAAEKMHAAFRELNQDSIADTAEVLMLVMLDALKSLTDLAYESVDDSVDDDDFSKFFHIRNNIKTDTGVSRDYEVLG